MFLFAHKRASAADEWPSLSTAVRQLLTDPHAGMTNDEWRALYDSVYAVCTNSQAEALYYLLVDFTRETVDEILRDAVEANEVAVAYLRVWRNFHLGVHSVNSIFNYLNRYWINKHREVYGEHRRKGVTFVNNMMLRVWREGKMFGVAREQLCDHVLDLLSRERKGEAPDMTLVKQTLDSFVAVMGDAINREEVYAAAFEKRYLEQTRLYFESHAMQITEGGDVRHYMQCVEDALVRERARCVKYLHATSLRKVMQVAEHALVWEHRERLHECVPELLDREATDELRMMFHLLRRVKGGLQPVQECVGQRVRAAGMDAVAAVAMDPRNPAPFVRALLSVHAKYKGLVEDAFHNHTTFVNALDQGCRRYINAHSKTPEMVAKYAHTLLDKGKTKMSAEDVEQGELDVMLLVKYIDMKDVFQRFYANMLARRLIQRTSHDDEAERSMIEKLKRTCGYDYTHHLERMYNDVNVGADISSKFLKWQENKRNTAGSSADAPTAAADFAVSVMVLTKGTWPLKAPARPVQLPRAMHAVTAAFEQFYCDSSALGLRHESRKLTWLHQFGRVSIRTLCTPRKYTLDVSGLQAAVLLHFNDAPSLTFGALAEHTAMDDEELGAVLLSLVRARVLCVDGEEEGEDEDDEEEGGENKPRAACAGGTTLRANAASFASGTVLRANDALRSKKIKFRIPHVNPQREKEESKRTLERVDEQRRMLTQSAIMRVMKARRMVTHNALIAEVMQVVAARFKPTAAWIKKQIEDLIDREYLERVGEGRDTYSYLA